MKHDHPRLGLLILRFLSHGAPGWTCGLIILCASFSIAADQEPSYNGRLLSQWLGDMSAMQLGAGTTGQEPHAEAIRAMGTNAIPTLLRWISYEGSPSEQSNGIGTTMSPFAVGRNHTLSPDERARLTEYAFGYLGAVARPGIPELTRLARTSSDSWRAKRCAASLANIGPEAIPSLLSLATNGPPWTRYWALSMVECFARHPAGVQTVPVLIKCLDDRKTHYPVAGAAQGVLIALGPAVTVTALTNALQSPSAETRLLAFGCLLEWQNEAPTNVPPTLVPVLRAAMRDPDSQVRSTATHILRRMGGWELVGEQWVRRHGTNTLHGITPDFFTNAPSR